MRRHPILCALVGVALAALWLGPADAQAQKRGGTLTVGNDEDSVGLDPHLSVAFASTNYFEHVYSGLLRFNAKMELEGDLAASWEAPDPRTYVFKLKKGVRFHNGKEMTSEDVVTSLNRWLKVATYGKALAPKVSVLTSTSSPAMP